MQRSFLIMAFLGLVIIGLSNFTKDRQEAFIMTTVNEGPSLPSTVDNYSRFDFPEHLFVSDTVFGYGGLIDTTHLSNIDDDKATLGRVLFYDEKLSALENISCATCHDQALSFTENKDFSQGVNGLTKRNSMHLNDLGWTNHEAFSWSFDQATTH